MVTHPAAWLFEDWPDGTFARQAQLLNTAMLRMTVSLRLTARAAWRSLESTK